MLTEAWWTAVPPTRVPKEEIQSRESTREREERTKENTSDSGQMLIRMLIDTNMIDDPEEVGARTSTLRQTEKCQGKNKENCC
jgi:hypothetical protein